MSALGTRGGGREKPPGTTFFFVKLVVLILDAEEGREIERE